MISPALETLIQAYIKGFEEIKSNQHLILERLKHIESLLSTPQLKTKSKNGNMAIGNWDDTINEEDVVNKFNISRETLRRMRREGKITNFRHLSLGTTGNPDRPGKHPVYSISELTELFCIVKS